MQKSNLGGFTILETIITLTVSCMLILIGSLKMDSYENQLLLINTERQVKTAIEQAARISTINHEKISVIYFAKDSYIQFKGQSYIRRLNINEKIKMSGLSNFNISSSGSMNPRTITFSNDNNVKVLKLQMMWGRAVDE